ncbi:MAG: hypothetical protein AB1761_18260 [Pseudomonadota bacterium]
MTRWASPVVDSEGRSVLAAAQTHGPVVMIATPRQALQCRPAARWKTIDRDRSLDDFDQVPLTGQDSQRIEAMFIRGRGRTPLVADMFMAADAPLLAFVETADSQRFRLLVAGGDVIGMVTLSDLQRLPVYSLLFSLLIAVEVLLVEWIRNACGDQADAWMQHLGPKRRKEIERHWKAAEAKNLGIDRLSCASFGQEIAAARGLGLFASEPAREHELLSLKQLRDCVCHAMEFAPTAEYALEIPLQARKARALAQWLVERINEKTQ